MASFGDHQTHAARAQTPTKERGMMCMDETKRRQHMSALLSRPTLSLNDTNPSCIHRKTKNKFPPSLLLRLLFYLARLSPPLPPSHAHSSTFPTLICQLDCLKAAAGQSLRGEMSWFLPKRWLRGFLEGLWSVRCSSSGASLRKLQI